MINNKYLAVKITNIWILMQPEFQPSLRVAHFWKKKDVFFGTVQLEEPAKIQAKFEERRRLFWLSLMLFHKVCALILKNACPLRLRDYTPFHKATLNFVHKRHFCLRLLWNLLMSTDWDLMEWRFCAWREKWSCYQVNFHQFKQTFTLVNKQIQWTKIDSKWSSTKFKTIILGYHEY